MPILIPFSQNSTIDYHLQDRPDEGTITCSLYTSNNSVLAASLPVSLDSVNTTLSGSINANSKTFSVVSGSGITRNGVYLLDGPETGGGEAVKVRTISGSNITLVAPTTFAHAASSSFYSTRITISLTGSLFTKATSNNRIRVDYKTSGAPQTAEYISFDAVAYVPVSKLTLADIKVLAPNVNTALPASVDWSGIKETAWNMLLTRIKANAHPGGVVGVLELTTAHGYLVRSLLAQEAGDSFDQYRITMHDKAMEELNVVLSVASVDINQDGRIAANERYGISTRLIRC